METELLECLLHHMDIIFNNDTCNKCHWSNHAFALPHFQPSLFEMKFKTRGSLAMKISYVFFVFSTDSAILWTTDDLARLK